MTKPTSDILERIYKNSSEHKDGVYTRLYRYLLRDDIYYPCISKAYIPTRVHQPKALIMILPTVLEKSTLTA